MRALLLRYLAARWKHPGDAAKRFIRAGLGLEERSRLLHNYWGYHFSRSRAAQARWAQNATGKTLTVLGAGPLLDLNGPALSVAFERFRLVDGNPLLVPGWSRLNKPFEAVITDVTNCMEAWLQKIRALREDWPTTLKVIEALAETAVIAYSAPAEGLLSLNILSQLEIGWQEAIEPILQKRFGRAYLNEREQDWLNAIRPTTRMLIEQHLAAIQASQAKHVLLITDLEYVEYKGRLYSRQRVEDPPLGWNGDQWEADAGIEFEVMSALEGIELDHDTFARWLPSYQLEWHENWLWHIAPNGTETMDFGKLHRVGAFALRQRDAVSV